MKKTQNLITGAVLVAFVIAIIVGIALYNQAEKRAELASEADRIKQAELAKRQEKEMTQVEEKEEAEELKRQSEQEGKVRETAAAIDLTTRTAPEGMVFIPAGRFRMGSPSGEGDNDEHPQHEVHIDAFYMDKHEVTNARFKAFIDETGYDGKSDADNDYLKDWKNGAYPSGEGGHPVIWVSWKNAQTFAKWDGKRLPTGSEWEYACRAGTTTKYSTGNSISHNDANYFGTEGKDRWDGTSPVGSFSSNDWGLYDMHGNAWEWCSDLYNDSYYNKSPLTNGRYNVVRGGSPLFDPDSLRSAARSGRSPDHTIYGLGFRCAQDS